MGFHLFVAGGKTWNLYRYLSLFISVLGSVFSTGAMAVIVAQSFNASIPWVVLLTLALILIVSLFYLFAALFCNDKNLESYLSSFSLSI